MLAGGYDVYAVKSSLDLLAESGEKSCLDARAFGGTSCMFEGLDWPYKDRGEAQG